jgi:glycolate oxidase iron-sulfur subunit
VARLLRAAFTTPRRARALLTGLALARRLGLIAVAKRLPGPIGRAAQIAPPAALRPHSHARSASVAPSGRARGHVVLLPGCVMDQGFAHVQRDTVRLLVATGLRVTVPRGPLCCGALHAHAGDDAGAERLTQRLDALLRPLAADFLVTDAAGCGAHLTGRLCIPAVDVLALVHQTGAPPLPSVVAPSFGIRDRRLRVAWDAPCHLLHGQRVTGAAEALLRGLADVDLITLDGADRCCGAAGTYALEQPELARRVLAEKLAAVRAAAPDVLVTSNPGCQSWLAAGLRAERPTVRVEHAVTLLARGLPTAESTSSRASPRRATRARSGRISGNSGADRRG